MTPRPRLLSLLALGIVACSSSGGGSSSATNAPRTSPDGQPLAPNFNPPPPPSDALQITTPIVPAFPPGGNKEYCYFSKVILDKETAFRAGQGFQTKAGHHAVIYWTTNIQPEVMRECSEDDLVSAHVLSGGGAESGNGIINDLPAGGAFHVPKGAQLMVNLHLLNAGAEPVDAQATVNVFYGDEKAASLTSFYVTGTDISIPPHQNTTYSASCTAKKDLQIVRILGHMHEHGTKSVITITRPNESGNVVYERPGAEDFAFNPPHIDYPIDKPLVVHAGDTITATCTWNNSLDKALTFPDEMCAGFGYILGADAEAGCANGQWNN